MFSVSPCRKAAKMVPCTLQMMRVIRGFEIWETLAMLTVSSRCFCGWNRCGKRPRNIIVLVVAVRKTVLGVLPMKAPLPFGASGAKTFHD